MKKSPKKKTAAKKPKKAKELSTEREDGHGPSVHGKSRGLTGSTRDELVITLLVSCTLNVAAESGSIWRQRFCSRNLNLMMT